MSTAPCARCQTPTDTDLLIPSATGAKVCLSCEEEIESLKKLRNGIWLTVASLPVLLFTSVLVFCIPYLGVFIAVVIGIGTVVGAVRAFRLGLSVQQNPDEFGVGSGAAIALMVTAGICGALSLGVTGLAAIASVGVLLAGFFAG